MVKLSADFRAATRIATLPLQHPPPAGTVTVRVLWAGINASDVNFSSGRYMGSGAEAQLPFGAGFEAVGTAVAVASDVQSAPPPQPLPSCASGAPLWYGHPAAGWDTELI